MLINNASSLGPVPLALLADTECEALEEALAVNVVGSFRLTKALFGALAASAREGRGALVINISSDAAVNAYPGWGAYGASKAALRHMTAIWAEEARDAGVQFLAIDPGDMDTPLHALAVPDADRSTLKRPQDAAAEIIETIVAALPASNKACRGDCMIAADNPDRRSAKLVTVAADGRIRHLPRAALGTLFQPGDLVVANDAATLPASLAGTHLPSGEPIEIRLAGWLSIGDPMRSSPSLSAPAIIARARKTGCRRRHFRLATGLCSARWKRSSSASPAISG